MRKGLSINILFSRLRSSLTFFAVTSAAVAVTLVSPLAYSLAESSGEWLEEFEEICSKTLEGDNLSMEELQSLIERTDKLISRIQASDNARKKVYIFRLEKCKSFFEYIIELKQRDP